MKIFIDYMEHRQHKINGNNHHNHGLHGISHPSNNIVVGGLGEAVQGCSYGQGGLYEQPYSLLHLTLPEDICSFA